MRAVNFYLGKFAALELVDASLKANLIDLIKTKFKTIITAEQIKVSKDGGIYLKIKPALKSEIFIHRDALARDLATHLAQSTPRRII